MGENSKISIALYLILAALFFYFGVDGKIVLRPANVVAEVGVNAMFKCGSNVRYPNWIYSGLVEDIATGAYDMLASECVYNGKWKEIEVRKSDPKQGNECLLIIKSTMANHSGVYTCTDPDRGGSSAVLTVIGWRMIFKEDRAGVCLNCTAYLTNFTQVPKENRTSSMRCELRYNSTGESDKTPRLVPNLSWTDPWGKRLDTDYDTYTTSRRAVSSMTFPVDRERVIPYTCTARFNLTWKDQKNAQFSEEISVQMVGSAPGFQPVALTEAVVFCTMAFHVFLKIFQ